MAEEITLKEAYFDRIECTIKIMGRLLLRLSISLVGLTLPQYLEFSQS